MTENEYKESINKVKNLIKFNKIKENFADLTTNDGSILRYEGEEYAIGSEVKVVTENGDELAPGSEWTLPDGTVIRTDENSLISEIVPASDSQEDQPEAAMSEQNKEKMSDDEAVVDSPEAKATGTTEEKPNETEAKDNAISDLNTKVLGLEEKVNELIAKNNTSVEAMSKTLELVEKIAEKPRGEAIDFKRELESTKEEFKSILHTMID